MTSAASAAERWQNLADTVFEHYTKYNGLPEQIATALAEDSNGFLWVGTQNGLARWDGYRFHNYRTDAHDPAGLPNAWITQLFADPDGRLWIGTSAGGLARYDREHDRFQTYPAGPGGLSGANVKALGDDGAHGLWIATDGGLDHLDPATGAITSLRHDGAEPSGLPDNNIGAVLRDKSGTLWAGTAAGLVRRANGAALFTPVDLPVSTDGAVAISALMEDAQGRIWVGTQRFGAFVIEPGNTPIRRILDDNGGGHSDTISSIAAADPGEIWLGTLNRGIVMVDTATWRIRQMRHDLTAPGSLANDGVWAILRDRAGSLWIGTYGGLSRRTNDQRAVLTLFGEINRLTGNTVADVLTIFEAPDGLVWLGLVGGGVDIIDPANGRVASLPPDAGHPDQALPADRTRSMAAVGKTIYLGTNRGLYSLETPGEAGKPLTSPVRILDYRVDSLLVDNGVLWIGGEERGLRAMRINGAHLIEIAAPDQTALTDKRVRVVRRGRDGDLWIGTRNGLNRLDLATGAVERIPAQPAAAKSLSNGLITSLLLDAQGRLWVSTLGGGICVLTGRDADGKPQFHRIGTEDGLPNSSVDALLADGSGKIWASTDDGMAVIDPQSFAIRTLRRSEGIVVQNFWANAAAVTRAGELLFGGSTGLTIIRPALLTDQPRLPPVVITDAQVGGHALPAGRFNGGGSGEPLIVTPDANSLAIEFSALDYTAPERNRYAYRLDGVDKDWIETDWTRRLAAYANLPPGAYTLRLRGSNHDGLWTGNALTVPINVLPAWYQTIWFRLGLGLIGIAAITALVQTRTAVLRRRQRELEMQVAQRTADLEQRSVELGVSLDQLGATQAQLVQQEKMAALGQLAAGIAHEIQNPLNFINNFSALSSELLDEVAHIKLEDAVEEVLDLVRTNLRAISSHGARIAAIVSGMLSHSRTGTGERSEVDLPMLLRNSLEPLTPDLAARPPAAAIQVDWRLADPLPKPMLNPTDIGMVLGNVLRNAVYALDERRRRESPGYQPILTVTARQVADKVEIIIHDNGTGIADSVKPRLFTPFFTTKPTGQGTGLGLSLSFDIIVKLYRGDLTIRSVEGAFTEATIILPLGL